MPSRYVVEASRHVTPRHGDVSRSERDIGVTDGGQPADTTRTPAGVTRDRSVTHTACPVGQKRDKPQTDAEREARADRWSRDLDHRRMLEALGEMRIMGRHAVKPDDLRDIAFWCKELYLPLDKGRAAYEAGRQDRARGVRCMCMRCNGQRVYEADRVRSEYSTRRYRELIAQGVGFEEASRRIENEISRGEHLER